MSTTIKDELDGLVRKIDIHKALVGFAYNAYAKLSLKGISKLVKSIINPIERIQATKWLEIYGGIYYREDHQTLSGELIPTYRYRPTIDFQFDLKKAWSNPYYSEISFHLSYPFLRDSDNEMDTNIFSPYWFIEPDQVRDNLIKSINVNSPSDPVIRQSLENAINAFWRSHKHDASIRSTQDNAQLLFKLALKDDEKLSKKIIAKTGSMLDNFLKADIAQRKAKATVTNEKIRPSESRPKGTEECHICLGSGKTSIGRSCSRCMGRGFIGKIIR